MPQKKQKLPGRVQEKSVSKVETDLGARTIETGGMYDGLPYKGRAITIKDNDPEYKKPQPAHDGHAEVFYMDNPEDKQAYNKLMDKMVKGYVAVGTSSKQIVYDTDLKTFIVFIEWTDQYYVSPLS